MTQTHKTVTILVVDDEQVHRFMLCSMFKEWGWRCVEADDGTTAVEAVKNNSYDAVLMDVRMAKMDGMEAFSRIHAMRPELPVIIMTAYSSVNDAVEAIQHGAHDYLTKPLDFDRLRLALQRALDRKRVDSKKQEIEKQKLTTSDSTLETGIIGTSAPMQELLEMIRYVAPTEATVLITGESGTGKELVAESLHNNSMRRDGPFIKVNCAALAETLLESELFGHEKGAFTGADRKKEGKFVQADGGTLFLDEIGETSQAMQVKLLRVLQEQELERVGGEETLRLDVRVIAATNRKLEEEVASGNFREDLYYRLNVVMLTVPALRQRTDDIADLVNFFVEKFARKNKREVNGITPECLRLLENYDWPGNVRELENAIERGVILMRGDQLTEKSLPLTLQKSGRQNGRYPTEGELPSSLQEAEKMLILQALEDTQGNKSEAARRLGISRKTLQNKLNKYNGSL